MSKHFLPFSVKRAREAQQKLCKRIIFEDRLPSRIRYVAGVDAAYGQTRAIGATTVLEYDSLELVEQQTAVCSVEFPYIPTLLSFREIPPVLQSIKKLKSPIDIFLADAHGYAHPYRCGFASHLGLVLNKPTIGVAKNRLIGEAESTPSDGTAYLHHNNEIIGAAVRTKPGEKQVYVSIGHMISLETAVKIVKHCATTTRVPLPLLKAHNLATEMKQKLNINSHNN